jgi:O-antigen/teichoic acid export membrane protein
MSKENKQTFMQSILTLMISQVVIKIFGMVYKLYLTNKQDFGDSR